MDATLHEDGRELDLGCGFDDFSESARVDWFETHPEAAAAAAEPAARRVLLQRAFLDAGFAPLADEWWHFELGTARWAREGGGRATLDAAAGGPGVCPVTGVPGRVAPARLAARSRGIACFAGGLREKKDRNPRGSLSWRGVPQPP